MTANNIKNYLRWITPTTGDPTYSILKAHLLFEELLRAQLAKELPHPKALDGARLTFTQLLAVVRASAGKIPVDCWIWKAIADLNKIRNLLSHETSPKNLNEKIAMYINYVEESVGVPLPTPELPRGEMSEHISDNYYRGIDMVTLSLYYVTADRFGFNIDEALERDNQRNVHIASQLS